ncbi:MAG: 50S ribosomal protein P1 [Nitrososphaerota archaeon]
MEYIYAALLLHKAGKPVNEEGIKSILSAAGIQPDDGRVKALVAALSEINIDEVLKSAAAAPFVATATAAPAASAQPEAKPKEEKKEEAKKKEEEEALAGLSALFG